MAQANKNYATQLFDELSLDLHTIGWEEIDMIINHYPTMDLYDFFLEKSTTGVGPWFPTHHLLDI